MNLGFIKGRTSSQIWFKRALFVGLLCCAGYFLYLVYSGYCFSQGRYLSDKEKIEIVVRKILARYPGPEDLAYRDLEDFFALNPNFCTVTKEFNDGDGVASIPFWSRILGLASDFVNVQYSFRYRDEDGTERQKLSKTHHAITSCGGRGIIYF